MTMVLLLFAAWTLLLLFATIGYFRWSRILTGRATMREWRPDEIQGTDWYRRALRSCELLRLINSTSASVAASSECFRPVQPRKSPGR